ncbi:hypothetical protein Pla52o_20500 [Novipirellula galeiformis]|uniref:Uncharacterized protein n=1 Tax=Novipirellula galeiformis TaxID=2528004 RepID=A0A5C6CLV2_9BACT|nr:hypothetical protein [Novipirellula galeiformis]TWU24126.1 hypothetical protein Pla52o_20500 [Novipirellula galeiformis]
MPAYRAKRIEKPSSIERIRLGWGHDWSACNAPVTRLNSPGAAAKKTVRVDASHHLSTEPAATNSGNSWLGLQAADLVERLQRWEADLDAREAQLNARTAFQEHLERQFRFQRQSAMTDLAEQTRSIEQIQAELKIQARRLAFE